MKIYDKKTNTVLGVKVAHIGLGIIILLVIMNVKSFFAIPLKVYEDVKKAVGFGEQTQSDKNSSEIIKDIDSQLKKDSILITVGHRQMAEDLDKSISGFGYNMTTIKNVFSKIKTPNDMRAVTSAYGLRGYGWFSSSIFGTGTLRQNLIGRLEKFHLNTDVSGTASQKITILDKLNWV